MRIVIAKVNETYFEGDVYSVTVPGSAGEMTILGHHMPLITTLRPGVITVRDTETNHLGVQYPIDGGILEVRPEGVTVLL